MKSSKAYKKNRWNVLFIGEHGKVVPIKHFKGIVSVLGLLFLALAASVTVLVWLDRHQTGEMKTLEDRLAKQVEKNRTLKEEKDRLLAQVVILESKLKTATHPASLPTGENPKRKTRGDTGSGITVPEKEAADKPKQPPQKTATSDHKPVSVDPMNIATENLVVCQEPHSNFMRVEFKVMNLGPKGAPVSGRAVIVLKKDDINPTNWLVLPNVPLQDRKPEGRRGRLFRIYNFRTIKFKVNSPASPDQFEYATIYTYTDDGEMLVERDYPLELTSICP